MKQQHNTTPAQVGPTPGEIGRWELCLRHLHQRLAPHFARPEVRQHALFALFDWSLVERWQQQRSPRGRPPHPESAYLKAFLLRLREGMMYTSQLRRFLLVHPLLVIELGFHLVLDPSAPYGFDVEASVPSEQWLRLKLRTLDRDLLQDLKLWYNYGIMRPRIEMVKTRDTSFLCCL